jgi:hypothetical protein
MPWTHTLHIGRQLANLLAPGLATLLGDDDLASSDIIYQLPAGPPREHLIILECLAETCD